MVLSSSFLISLVALLLSVGVYKSHQVDLRGTAVKLIRDKLQTAYVHNVASGITDTDLADAYEEYERFNEFAYTQQNQFKLRRPTIQLTTDLLTAMRSHYESIHNEASKQEFLTRLEVFYRTMYDIYLSSHIYQRPIADAQVEVMLLSSIYEAPHSVPMTRNLINNAEVEYDRKVAYFNGITSNDAQARREELNALLNYINLDETRLFRKYIFSRSHGTQINVSAMRARFIREASRLNFRLNDEGELFDKSVFVVAADDFSDVENDDSCHSNIDDE